MELKDYTTEEKARAYDDAIKKAESLYKASEPMSGCNVMIETLFPELKQSGDEKARKAIMALIEWSKSYSASGITNDDAKKMLAWLERQGGKHPDPYNGISFEYNGHIWGMCARDNGVDISCDKHLIKHLEKQGEQKFEMKTAEESLGVDSDIYNKIVDECIFGEQEPEENKGNLEGISANWSEEDDKVRKEIINYFRCQSEEEPTRKEIHNKWIAWLENIPYTIDHEKREGFHLGYKAYHEEQGEQNLAENAKPQSSTPMSYGKELEKRMCEACNRFYAPNTDSNRYSASDLFYAGVKAERDLNTLAWSEEDDWTTTKIMKVLLGSKIFLTPEETNELVYWLKSIKDRVQPQPKQEWSEEDEKNLRRAIRATKVVYPVAADWLQSLKGRVQPKQEWSEEDEEHIDSLLKRLDALCRNKFERTRFAISEDRDWLKSLRPQNRWKPSELQLGCLSDAIEYYNSFGYPAPKLKELLDDLKKLKEE